METKPKDQEQLAVEYFAKFERADAKARLKDAKATFRLSEESIKRAFFKVHKASPGKVKNIDFKLQGDESPIKVGSQKEILLVVEPETVVESSENQNDADFDDVQNSDEGSDQDDADISDEPESDSQDNQANKKQRGRSSSRSDQGNAGRDRSRSPVPPKDSGSAKKGSQPSGSGGPDGGNPGGSGGSGGGGGGSGGPGGPTNAAQNSEDAMIEKIIKTMRGLGGVQDAQTNHAMISSFGQLVKYYGVDLAKMARTIIKRALVATNNHHANAKKFILKATVIGVMRGNNVEKILKKSSPTARIEISNIQSALMIANKAEGDPEKVTFSRVCQCFPEYTIVAAHYSQPPLATGKISNAFPYSMRSGSFAALIPTEQSYTTVLKQAYTMYQASVSLAYKKKNSSPLSKEGLEEQLNFTNIAIDQSKVPQESRINIVTSEMFGIIVAGEPVQYLKELSTAFVSLMN